MAKYKVTVPPTREVGSYSTIVSTESRFSTESMRFSVESMAKRALLDYNNARTHDGLPPLNRMPKGTKYKRIE